MGHPPTPPPPYSENSPEAAPALPALVSPPDTVTVPPPAEEAPDLDSQASSSSSNQEAESRAECAAEGNVEVPLMAEEDEEEDEELITRRRHVTGDSGIEVCVCQLDVDEGSEEECDEEHRMCKVSGRDCCSGQQQQQPFGQKEHTAELPNQTASTSTGDHMV